MKREPLYTVYGPKTMFEMTREEVQEALEQTDILLLPIGSLEQHGPHLPLGSDTMQAVEIAQRAQLRLAEEGISVVVGPPLLFGLCSYHMDFPGTVTLQPDTMLAVIEEVCLSLYQHGFRKFAFILGHGGNWPIMQVAAQSVVSKTKDAKVVSLNWLKPMFEKYPEILTSKRPEKHSGEGETSRMLATHSELVELDRAQTYYFEGAADMESADHPLLGGGIYEATRSMKASPPVGSIGDPKLATVETGEKLYELVVDWVAKAVKQEFISKG